MPRKDHGRMHIDDVAISAQLQPETEDVLSQSIHWCCAAICVALPQGAQHCRGRGRISSHEDVHSFIKALSGVHLMTSICGAGAEQGWVHLHHNFGLIMPLAAVRVLQMLPAVMC